MKYTTLALLLAGIAAAAPLASNGLQGEALAQVRRDGSTEFGPDLFGFKLKRNGATELHRDVAFKI
ncbi:hypothetical protein F5Y10DRAFT_272684 [Nemania abortiva]|nr:hypothetical protein F5Y10DRAFT_272684 [Nemania abortiva]